MMLKTSILRVYRLAAEEHFRFWLIVLIGQYAESGLCQNLSDVPTNA
jgi:hypothetical protein